MLTNQHPWQCVFDARTSMLQHLFAPVTLESFTLYLTFREGNQQKRESLQFKADRDACSRHESIFHARHPAFQVHARCTHDDPLHIQLTLKNVSKHPLEIMRMEWHVGRAKLGGHGQPLHFFKNGYQSWSETRSFQRGEKDLRPIAKFLEVSQTNLHNRASNQKDIFISEMYTLVTNPLHKQTILIGQAGNFDQYFYLRVNFNPDGKLPHPPDLHMIWDFGGQVLEPMAEQSLDDVLIYVGEDETELLNTYMQHIRPKTLKPHTLPVGWCSWYYYFHQVTGGQILENIHETARQQPKWNIFVLDDGYQAAVGDWLKLNKKFPTGLKLIADEICAAGMRPGIWTAPFIARPNAQIAREHPEWFLQHLKRHKPVYAGWNPGWGGNYFALDVTHPGVQDYLDTVFRTFAQEYGFEFFKLDFTFAASLPGCAHDPHLSTAQRLRLGYQLIRDAVGPEALILGCGSPLTPAIGMVDAMRIGPDVAPYWTDWARSILTRDAHALCTRNAVRSILNRAPMHRNLWINDPDCLMLRDTDTKLTHDERYTLINTAIITGGMSIISDRLVKLESHHWSAIDQIIQYAKICDQGEIRVLDMMAREMPELVFNSQGFLAVFNFSDHSAEKNIPYLQIQDHLKIGTTVTDLWNGEQFRVNAQGLHLGMMPPHSSHLFRICEND